MKYVNKEHYFETIHEPGFQHCVVCPSSKYGFVLLLWYLQTFSYSNEYCILIHHSVLQLFGIHLLLEIEYNITVPLLEL